MESHEEFSNLVILPDQLPPLEEQDFVPLEKKYKKLKHINLAIFAFFSLGAVVVSAIVFSDDIPLKVSIIAAVVLILLFAWRFSIVNLAFPKKGYLLREQDVSYRSGLLFYKMTTIPFNRIQHVEVSQGLIEKSIGLATLKVFTAGGSVSDQSIPGLLLDKAHQIETFLLTKVSTHE